MRANAKTKRTANRIAAEYSRWCNPKEIGNMYRELEEIGITVGLITNRRDYPELGSWEGSCEWYMNGEEVENSRFIFGVYEGNATDRNEYNIYFS